jgi:hypothetical protein
MGHWEEHRAVIHEEWRAEWLRTHPPILGEATWNYLFTGGKEIRARLFCELWEYLDPGTPVVAELAFVVECLHAASLIIDDSPYMDNTPMRRGRPTLHTRFPMPVVAHICYDVLHMARRCWVRCRPSHISQTGWNEWMRQCLQRLIVGQWLDLGGKPNEAATALDLASLKTGVLFEWVAGTVARCVGLEEKFWGRWGNQVGVLFQWTDDWNDREEDRAAGSRNAFLEAPDATVAQYRVIWDAVRRAIGRAWWERPFGAYLGGYFSWMDAASAAPAVPAPTLQSLPSLFSAIPETNGTPAHDLIVLMYHVSNTAEEEDEPETLWERPWEEWQGILEAKREEWCMEAEQRTGVALRPLMERVWRTYQAGGTVREFIQEK